MRSKALVIFKRFFFLLFPHLPEDSISQHSMNKKRRAVGMLNPMRDKNEGRIYQRGEKGRHLSPRLVQKIAEGKTYELSWKVKVTGKKM